MNTYNPTNLITRLQEIGLSPSVIREVLLSRYACKVTRSYVDDRQLLALAPCLKSMGLNFILSAHKVLHRPDSGKGGFSNSIAALLPEDSFVGHFTIYIGTDMTLLEEARRFDECGDHDNFGAMLGIPDCCRVQFTAQENKAMAEQNDYSEFISTVGGINSWCVHYGQYFGYGLVSHFPCAFSCQSTAELAKSNWQTLSALAPAFAQAFLSYQHASYLYTEYDGVYAFFSVLESEDESGTGRTSWSYDNKCIEATHNGMLFDFLELGDTIAMDDENQLSLYNKRRPVFELPNCSARLCFHPMISGDDL